MTEVSERLNKQAQWQKRRRALSWPEKVRLAEAVRDSVEALRRAPAEPSPSSPARTRPVPADRPGK
jgi:hypothetical protein